MTRRFFCSIVLFCSWMVGCSKPKPTPPSIDPFDEIDELKDEIERRPVGSEPTLIDPIHRVAKHLERETDPRGVSVDPFSLLTIAAAICSIIQFCFASKILSLQRIVKRNPHGATAIRLRGKLKTRILSSEINPNGIALFKAVGPDEHVNNVINAFIHATPEELIELLSDLKEPKTVERLDRSNRAVEIAHEWSRLIP